MNEIINQINFVNSSFEFISFIVYMTIGILMFLYVFFSKKEGKLHTEQTFLIGVSFAANALILVLRQILNRHDTFGFVYDVSCVFVMMQLFYPLAFYLQTVSEKRERNFLQLLHTLLPIFFVNVVLILMVHFRISVKPVYLIAGGSVFTLYTVFRICQFAGSYCKYIKYLINYPLIIRGEIVRLTLIITSISILLITISNILLSDGNTLMIPSLVITAIISTLLVQRVISEGQTKDTSYDVMRDDKTFIISPNHNSIENYKQNEIKERLEEYFEKNKPYLNKKISIKEVARKLFTNKTYLSKVINENMGVNFNQFVNSYRMKEVDNLLKEDAHIGMKELCNKSGFGCMATFVVAFRLYKGAPPAEWCKKNVRNSGKYLNNNDNE